MVYDLCSLHCLATGVSSAHRPSVASDSFNFFSHSLGRSQTGPYQCGTVTRIKSVLIISSDSSSSNASYRRPRTSVEEVERSGNGDNRERQPAIQVIVIHEYYVSYIDSGNSKCEVVTIPELSFSLYRSPTACLSHSGDGIGLGARRIVLCSNALYADGRTYWNVTTFCEDISDDLTCILHQKTTDTNVVKLATEWCCFQNFVKRHPF